MAFLPGVHAAPAHDYCDKFGSSVNCLPTPSWHVFFLVGEYLLESGTGWSNWILGYILCLMHCCISIVRFTIWYIWFDSIQGAGDTNRAVNRFGASIGWWIAGTTDELLVVHELCDSGTNGLCPKPGRVLRDPVLETLQKCSPKKYYLKRGNRLNMRTMIWVYVVDGYVSSIWLSG